MTKYTRTYILRGQTPVPCEDAATWGEWFETSKEDRRVAYDIFPNEVSVSTVFLGIDHSYGDGPSILFETMVFGGKHDQYTRRYRTWKQAMAGHRKTCVMVYGKGDVWRHGV